MTQRRAVITIAALGACGAAALGVAGVLPQAAAVATFLIAACAAAFGVAAGLGLDRLLARGVVAEPEGVIAEVVRCAEHAARSGVGGLGSVVIGRHCPGLRRGLQLVVSGEEPAAIKRIMERELDETLERHARGGVREVLLAAVPIGGAVAVGAIVIGVAATGGTPAGLGTGAAAGVFGGLLACMLAMTVRPATPAELAQREAREVLARTIAIRGVTLIASGTSPLEVERELRLLLPPTTADGVNGARRAA